MKSDFIHLSSQVFSKETFVLPPPLVLLRVKRTVYLRGKGGDLLHRIRNTDLIQHLPLQQQNKFGLERFPAQTTYIYWQKAALLQNKKVRSPRKTIADTKMINSLCLPSEAFVLNGN